MRGDSHQASKASFFFSFLLNLHALLNVGIKRNDMKTLFTRILKGLENWRFHQQKRKIKIITTLEMIHYLIQCHDDHITE